MNAEFKPEGFEFLDKNRGPVIFIQKGPWTGWLAYQHPDGQWVSLRLATQEDMDTIRQRMAVGN